MSTETMRIFESPATGNAPIYFGEETRESLVAEIETLSPDKVFIVTDKTVETLHTEEILAQLPYQLDSEVIVFNEGEENKNLSTLQHVAGDMMRAGITNDSLVLNVGGGAVLNMGALAASLLCHGVRFAQVPTSFAAGWQSVASNMQAINFVAEANALRVFRSPEFSIVDPYFLATEPERQVKASMSEVGKFALVHGGNCLGEIESAFSEAGFDKPPKLATTLRRCLAAYIEVAKSDPEEKTIHEWTHYGETLGAALEKLSEGRLLRGEATYHGMCLASVIAGSLGLMSQSEIEKHTSLVARLPVDVSFPRYLRTENIIYKLHGNNKTTMGSTSLMLLGGVGEVAGAPTADSPHSNRVSVPDRVIAEAIDYLKSAAEG